MLWSDEVEQHLTQFVRQSRFAERGAIVTDLDGTAVHEQDGRVIITQSVERALVELRKLGRPTLINSLRFPLSVMRTFGREWVAIADAPIPTVSLNGSLIGRIGEHRDELVFEEIDAFPLAADEIDELLRGVRGLLDNAIDDLLVFWYPRDWRRGEQIWTPVAERIAPTAQRYRSAAEVTSGPFELLRDALHAQDVCMVFLLIQAPEDKLMAYQHTKRSSFFTHRGVDKLFGTQQLAARLGAELEHSVGAGDTELDSFLAGVGLSVHVGPIPLDFKGSFGTVRIADSSVLGELLFRLAALHRELPAARQQALPEARKTIQS